MLFLAMKMRLDDAKQYIFVDSGQALNYRGIIRFSLIVLMSSFAQTILVLF